MSRFVQRISELLFLLCLLAVVLLFSGKTISTIYVKETVFRYLAVLALATGLPLLSKGEWRWLSLAGMPILAYWAWLLISVITAEYPVAAAGFAGHQVLFTALGLFVAIRSHESQFASRTLWFLVFLVVVTSAYALLQWVGIDFFEWGEFTWDLKVSRVSSSFGNPNFFAGFLVGTVPILLGLGAAAAAVRVRILLFLLALAAVLCGVLTFSRAGVGGIVTGVAVFLTLMIRGYDHSARRFGPVPWRKWVAAGAIMLFFAVIALSATAPGRALTKRLRHSDLSASARALIYVGTAQMITANPVFGVGADNFGAVFPRYRPDELARIQPPSVLVFDRAHSEYLQIAGELGLPGLVIFLWAVAVPFQGARRYIRRPGGGSSGPRWFLISGMLGAYTGILVQNLASVNLRRTSTLLLFWVLWGLAVGLSDTMTFRCGGSDTARRMSRGRLGLLGLAIVVTVPLLMYNMRWYMGDQLAQRGRVARAARDNARVDPSFRQALRFNPLRVDINYFAGSGYYALGLSDPVDGKGSIRRALECYQNVEHLGGAFADVYLNQAACLVQLGEIDAAIETFEEGIRLDPYHAKLHDYLCRAYLLKSRTMALQQRPEESRAARTAARAAYDLAREYYGPSVDRDASNADLRLAYARFLTQMSREFVEDRDTLRKHLAVALREVEEAIRLDPYHPAAQALRRQLLLLTDQSATETEEVPEDGG